MAENVKLKIDGKDVEVPKGTNLIEAAKTAGIDIPFYCYHRHLSIAGNCRMCQVQVEGQPKLTIACNTGASEGMVVHTHITSQAVADAQRATLEFLLINHPLDCTVCDQAGHCKLQDYYYDYNATPSRFIEDKQQKVKAEVFGPEVIYDGERCIVCTRCSRFCDEVTKTSELGVFNRGDRSVIGVFPGKELDNALSGTVVDLCPVGALTHRRWRFNTRIWYTSQENSICTGCSTGCNVKVAVRDGQIVHVKGRLNSDVNQEWMCDEGRYGFDRFQPAVRLTEPRVVMSDASSAGGADPFIEAAKLAGTVKEDAAVFLSPFLTLEEMWSALVFAEKVMGLTLTSGRIAVQTKPRELNAVQRVLVSPDYAPNARGAAVLGLVDAQQTEWRKVLHAQYQNLLNVIRREGVKRVLFVGDFALPDEDLDPELQNAIRRAAVSVFVTAKAPESADTMRAAVLHDLCTVFLPGRTVNEKAGTMINAQGRLQRVKQLLAAPFGAIPEHQLLQRVAARANKPILPADVVDDRAVFFSMTKSVALFSGLTPMRIGELGIPLNELTKSDVVGGAQQPAG